MSVRYQELIPTENSPYLALKQLSHVENMFEYYFLLTKADGEQLDVIAGQSGFLPAGPEPVGSDPLEKEVMLARPENEKPAGLPDHYDSGPWLPACVCLRFSFGSILELR